MGYQVIKQPDGDLAIWSTSSDQFIVVDAEPEDVMTFFKNMAAEESELRTQRVLDAVLAGEPQRAYAQFALSWKDVRDKYPPKGDEEW